MLRRCALELSSSGRSAWRRQGPVSAQTPFFLYARSSLSSASRLPQTPPSAAKLSKPPPGQPSPAQGPASQNASGSGSFLPKLLLGGIVVGAAVIAAHEAGYVDLGRSHAKNESTPIETSKQDAIRDLNDAEHAEDRGVHLEKEPTGLTPAANEDADETVNSVNIEEPDTGTETTSSEETYSQERSPKAEEQQQPSVIQNDPSSPDQQVSDSETPFEDTMDLNNGVKQMGVSSEENQEIPFDNKVEISIHDDVPAPEETTQNDSAGYETEPESLAGSYSLQDEVRPETSSYKETSTSISAKELQAPVVDIESSKSKDKPSDDKIVLDFIEAIHVAEKRQAEFDFRTFEEEKRMLKEKYEKELRDARARELMYAEEAAILDKELNKERAKAATTVKLLQEKAEENLRSELQRKEEDAEMQLQKIKEIAKGELNAAIASEKSSQMEKIAEANLHINALCMAFYARSEEARQSHSVHKLALGALALEDALSKGLPIRAEIEDLHASLVDIKSDSFLDLVLSSLPEETLYHGTNTRFQLNQKFDALKGTLRHFSLIPPGGGGILTHAVAHVASFVKVKENDMSGDGIESVISRVENLLAEGKLSEAADALEGGVCETEAAGAVRDWVRQARNRAIAEQAIALIQSYATSISLT